MAPHLPHPHLHAHAHSHAQSGSSPALSAPLPGSGGAPPPLSTTAKGARYAATLDTARRLQLFVHPSPALAKGYLNTAAARQLSETATAGTAGAASVSAGAADGGMDWKELLRKFRKHNPTREVTALAAQTEQLVHSHLVHRHASLATVLASSTSDQHACSLPPRVPEANRTAIASQLDALAHALPTAATEVERESTRVVLAWGRYMNGQPHEAREALAGLQGRQALPVAGEGYDLTLRVLAEAVDGYLAEDAQETDSALAAYSRAAELYRQALTRLASSSKDEVALHRIGGHALFKLCVLSPTTSTPVHVLYLERSESVSRDVAGRAFPAAERLWLHRALRRIASSRPPSSLTSPSVDAETLARSNRAEEALIRQGTSLPPAGETNAVYLRFLDEVVRTWRLRGASRAEAKEVIEILYAALSHTFQSHLLLRHLIRALSIAGRPAEAAKALQLYRELWDKARETDAKEVAREMRMLRARAWREAAAGAAEAGGKRDEGIGEKRAAGGGAYPAEKEEEDGGEEEGPYASDIDSDRAFVETALFGVRLLCRRPVDRPDKAVDLARRARAIFDEERDVELRADKQIEARIEMVLGSALGALAAKEASPQRLSAQQEEALEHLATAVALDPSSFAAHYAFAFQLLELRQVTRALDAARAAVERDQRSREAWHLLALCVSAQKDMRGALEVLETALEMGDVSVDGPGETGLEDKWDRPTDEVERLAISMQLRLTKSTVIEYLEGAPAALVEQQSVLAFFATACSRLSDGALGPRPAAISAPTAAAFTSKPTGGLAPPVPLINGDTTDGVSLKLGRTTSILGRHRSVKRQSGVPNGSGTADVAPESVNASLANLSLSGSSTPTRPALRPVTEGNPLATKLLVDTWLACAASLRRARRFDEARGALGEAEGLNADDPDVWSQTALLHLARGDVAHAREALTKGLSFDPLHVPSRVLLARVYLSATPLAAAAPLERGDISERPSSATAAPYSAAPPPPPSHLTSAVPPPARPVAGLALSLPLAETVLRTLTAHEGWDVPEAWAELARCYRLSEPRRPDQERECLKKALQLEQTRPIRPLSVAVPRVL